MTTRFVTSQDFGQRLLQGELLTPDEIEDGLPHVPHLNDGAKGRYFAELLTRLGGDIVRLKEVMGESVRAIEGFDKSSGKLSRRVYFLTGALVVPTGVLTLFTVLLWLKH